ncbi:hypothetical protein ACIO6T_30680 [Streptomyces sp. NPDC087532]|uniref:hypothetical protein n=1 Tax=Streptomyces sp. NPDC087532 TaxID=3365795 RepID=UPI00382C9947
MPIQPSRPRSEVVTVLQDRLERAREAAVGKGMPRDAPWSVPVIQPEVSQFGGAEAVRSAARAAARKAGIRVHTYATCRADNAPEQMVMIGNRGAPPQRRVAPEPDPRWPAFTLNPDARPGRECDCGNEPCLSAGLDWAARERWLIADWYSLTPLTDLRTLPAEQRSRDRDALFARHHSRSWDDHVLDLALFRDGSMELGPLGDVQVYATNPHGRYKGLSHGVGCRYAEFVGQQHEILALADFVPLLPEPVQHSSRGYDSFADMLQEMMYEDRSAGRWCHSCGGYAVRRLSPDQCAYYQGQLAAYRASC